MNLTVGVLVAGGGLLFAWSGIVDPAGGLFAEMGRVLNGQPASKPGSKPVNLGGQNAGGTTGAPLSGHEAIVAAARTQIGVPYSWGGGNAQGPTKGIGIGAGTTGFDCSGLTEYAYWAGAHLAIPGTAATQQLAGRATTTPEPGDLVFFGVPAHHVGVYVGPDQMIAAPHTGSKVHQSAISAEGHQVVTYRTYFDPGGGAGAGNKGGKGASGRKP